jgi:hypothetical protein
MIRARTPEEREQDLQAKRNSKAAQLARCAESVDSLEREEGKGLTAWARKVLDRVRRGSLRSAVSAKCYDCTGYQKAEPKHCVVVACPLWAFRPGAQLNAVSRCVHCNHVGGEPDLRDLCCVCYNDLPIRNQYPTTCRQPVGDGL